jgi:flagellar biosynthesis protein FlhG
MNGSITRRWRLHVAEPVDQASGLRRLLARTPVRSVTVVGGKSGIGRSAILVNVAAALSRSGRSVLVLDQNQGRSTAAAYLGIHSAKDLKEVIEGRLNLTDIVVTGMGGVRLISGTHAFHTPGNLPQTEEQRLTQAFSRMEPKVDFLLVDAPAGDAIHTPSSSLAAHEVVVVVSPQRESITSAYALIKRLSWDFARRRFHIVVNRVRSGTQADALFDNLSFTAKQFLGLELEFCGAVPEDAAMREAVRLREPVIDSHPNAMSAIGCRLIAGVMAQWSYPGEGHHGGFVRRPFEHNPLTTMSENS